MIQIYIIILLYVIDRLYLLRHFDVGVLRVMFMLLVVLLWLQQERVFEGVSCGNETQKSTDENVFDMVSVIENTGDRDPNKSQDAHKLGNNL